MPATAAGSPTQGESPATPAITVTRAGVVNGADFLPDHEVTVRITRRGEDISDYLTYTTDRNGQLYADLPATAVSGIVQITATDHRPDPDGLCGRVWSNTCTFSASDS